MLPCAKGSWQMSLTEGCIRTAAKGEQVPKIHTELPTIDARIMHMTGFLPTTTTTLG